MDSIAEVHEKRKRSDGGSPQKGCGFEGACEVRESCSTLVESGKLACE